MVARRAQAQAGQTGARAIRLLPVATKRVPAMRLVLMRHAKAALATESAVSDIDRPLARRGIAAADEMGAWMARQGLRPGVILCSPARRTRQTLLGVLPHLLADLPANATMRLLPALYGTTRAGYVDVIAAEGAGETLLVIGHNPAIQEAAIALVGEGPEDLRAGLRDKFATAAVAVMDFDLDSWRAVARGGARLVAFAAPG